MKNLEELKPAKACYNHLGGKLGTLLFDMFIEKSRIAKQNSEDKTFSLLQRDKKNL